MPKSGLAAAAGFEPGGKAQRATAILESNPVISGQLVTETLGTLTRKYRFTLAEAHEVALGLIEAGGRWASCAVHDVTVRPPTPRSLKR